MVSSYICDGRSARLGMGKNRNHTHSEHKSICGEVVNPSGGLKGMNLTEYVRALVPFVRCREKTSGTNLRTREDLREHCLGVIVEEGKQPGG